MAITLDFNDPFYSGGSVVSTTTAPSIFPVALAGHGYQVDLLSGEFHHLSIPLLRQQSDDSVSPAETSLNPDDLWRRAQDSWHHGAGQIFRDRPDADPERFRSSKGIDPWTKYQFSLHQGTTESRNSSSSNLRVVTAGTRMYAIDGSSLVFTTNLTSYTTVTGGTPGTFQSVASDGFTVYAADGADIYSTTTAGSTKSVFSTINATVVGYTKGRIMAGAGASIYNPTPSVPNPSALFTHANTDFSWVGFAEGQAAIYAAGFSGDKSLIYRLAVKPDASALDQPIIAGTLPDGEIIRAIGGYLGFIFLGTDKGWRFCTPDSQGNLTIGALVETPSAVRCFEGQSKFVWWGYTNYDTSSTGLGRMDLTVVVDALVPAYASDLMATGQGNVNSVVTFLNRRVFAVASDGIFAEDPLAKVSTASIDSGFVGFGLPDTKVGLFFDVRTDPLTGDYSAAISSDGGNFVSAGSESEAGSTGEQFPMNERRAERFENRLTLNRSGTSVNLGPVVNRWTMKAIPAPELREYVYIPLLLHDVIELRGKEHQVDVAQELSFIKGLRASQDVIVYQEGNTSYSGVIADYDWRPYSLEPKGRWFNGTCVVKFKRFV